MIKKSVGYITGHKFGGWNIPQKIQTAIIHFYAKNNNIVLFNMIVEYKDSKKNDILIKELQENKNIRNVFFTSTQQLKKLNNKLFNILKNYNLYFFLENIVIKSKSEFLSLKKHTMLISKRREKTFRRKNYLHTFYDFKKKFKN